MKKDEIEIGATYAAKVSDRVVPVRIDRENPRGGWDATNLVTNKQVRIKSAQRLRGAVERGAGKAKAEAKAKADPQDEIARTVEAVENGNLAEGVAVPVTKKRGAKPAEAKAKKEAKPGKERGLSCLDAAVEVLRAAGGPMQCKAMVEEMARRKLWTTSAPTPAATLYSAILREIQKKPAASRFEKTARGHFALTANA